MCAPRRALHSYGAYLHCAPDLPDSNRDHAERLLNTHPRTLLNMAFPGCHSRLYRLLDRAGDRVRGANFYRRVNYWLRSELAEVVLNAPVLDDKIVKFCNTIFLMDPFTSKLAQAFAPSAYEARALEELVFLLTIKGALDGVTPSDLPPRPTRKSVTKFLSRHVDLLRAPESEVRLPPTLHMVRTVGELDAVGRKFNNCLRRRRWGEPLWLDMINGRQMFLTCDDPPLVISMQRYGDGVWHMDQIAGPNNGFVEDEVRRRIIDDMSTASGIVLIENDLNAFVVNMASSPMRLEYEGAEDQDEDQEATA